MQPLKTLKPFELNHDHTDLSGNSPQIYKKISMLTTLHNLSLYSL